MNSNRTKLSQPIRLLFLIAYILFLFLINYLAFNQWMPLNNYKGFWFYSGASALILGSLLATPYFTSPANAISYSVAALIAIFSYEIPNNTSADIYLRSFVIAIGILIICLSLISILFKDSRTNILHNFSELGRIIADHLGNPHFLYSILIIYALWEFHRDSPKELFFISAAGIIVVSQQPLELISSIFQKAIEKWRDIKTPEVIGKLIAYQIPDVMLIRQEKPILVKPGTCVVVSENNLSFRLGVVVGVCGRDDGVILRAIEINCRKGLKENFRNFTKNMAKMMFVF